MPALPDYSPADLAAARALFGTPATALAILGKVAPELASRLDLAGYILQGCDGILHRDGRWKVIVDGHQVGIWSKRRWAKRDLRSKLREARRG